jgi:hypothetical protein
MQNLDFYISKNGRYMMLETSIYDRVNNRYADINEISFSDLINIIGENIEFMSQDLKSDLLELSSFTRKTVYHVLEYFETDKKLSLMTEYEVKFGSPLLTENVVNPKQLIRESWDWVKQQTQLLEQTFNPFNRDFYTSSNWKEAGTNLKTGATSAVKAVTNAVLNPIDTAKKGIEWVKENGIGGVMEKVREGLSSGPGIAIQIFAQFTGVGNIGVAVIWGAMLLWDLYKVFTGKEWNWIDLIFDVLGILSTGAAKSFKIAAKSVGVTGQGGLAGMRAGLAKLSTNPSTKGFMSTISKGFSKVLESIKSSGAWLSEKLGIKWINDVVGRAGTWMTENILNPILGKTTSNVISKGTKATVKNKAQSDMIGDTYNTGTNLYNKFTGGGGNNQPVLADMSILDNVQF